MAQTNPLHSPIINSTHEDAQQSDAADVPKRHALCKDEEHNARLFSTPLIWAFGDTMSKVTVPADVLERIRVDFVNHDVARVTAILSEYSGPERGRVLRCIVHLSNGSLEALREHVRNAKTDYRDVIFWAEYDRDDDHVHDFSKGFS
jgi:hypothetical protein